MNEFHFLNIMNDSRKFKDLDISAPLTELVSLVSKFSSRLCQDLQANLNITFFFSRSHYQITIPFLAGPTSPPHQCLLAFYSHDSTVLTHPL